MNIEERDTATLADYKATHDDHTDCRVNHRSIDTIKRCMSQKGFIFIAPKEETVSTYKHTINVRPITSIDGRTINVMPDISTVSYDDHETLIMTLQAMAVQNGVMGYAGTCNGEILVVTTVESYYAQSGRIIASKEQAPNRQQYELFYVYGRQQHIFRTGAKFARHYTDHQEMKKAMQDLLKRRDQRIIGILVFCGGEVMYVKRDEAVKINHGITRRRAFGS